MYQTNVASILGDTNRSKDTVMISWSSVVGKTAKELRYCKAHLNVECTLVIFLEL